MPALRVECAAKVFGAPARLGEAPNWVNENLRDPGYHTALGVLYFGVSSQGERAAATRRRGGFFQSVSRLFGAHRHESERASPGIPRRRRTQCDH